MPIQHNGEGYRDYAVRFCNTNKKLVDLFDNLFFDLFGINGRIAYEDRENKKRLWSFCKYSKKIFLDLRKLGFPEGVKRDILRITDSIWKGNINEKAAFIKGVLITDGCLRKQGSILFHSGSKLFLNDLADLMKEVIGVRKPVKEYIQREKYYSYQLNLNKKETAILLSQVPPWDNGTPHALSP